MLMALVTWRQATALQDRSTFEKVLPHIKVKPNAPYLWLDLARTEKARDDQQLQDNVLETAYELSKNRPLFLKQVWNQQLIDGDYLKIPKIGRRLVNIDIKHSYYEVFNIAHTIFGIDAFIEQFIPEKFEDTRLNKASYLRILLSDMMKQGETTLVSQVWSAIDSQIQGKLVDRGFLNKIYSYLSRVEDRASIQNIALTDAVAQNLSSGGTVSMNFDTKATVSRPFCWSFGPLRDIDVIAEEAMTILQSTKAKAKQVFGAKCYLPLASDYAQTVDLSASWAWIEGVQPKSISAKLTHFNDRGEAYVYPKKSYQYSSDDEQGGLVVDLGVDKDTLGIEFSLLFTFDKTGEQNAIGLRQFQLRPRIN